MRRILMSVFAIACSDSGTDTPYPNLSGDTEESASSELTDDPEGETAPPFTEETDLPQRRMRHCDISAGRCSPTWYAGETVEVLFTPGGGWSERTEIAWTDIHLIAGDAASREWTVVDWDGFSAVNLTPPSAGQWVLTVRARGAQYDPWVDCFFLNNYRDVVLENGYLAGPPDEYEDWFGEGCAGPAPNIPGFDPWYMLIVTSISQDPDPVDTDLPADTGVRDTGPASDTDLPTDTAGG